MTTTAPGDTARTEHPVEHVDIVVIGAGFSGMYALYKIRTQGTHSVIAFETGDGVGGTWYWNRYPGARVDIESMEYSYSFDEELQQEWAWPELFSAQPDLERYANHVADRFHLRDLIRFESRVNRVRWDEDERRWHVQTDSGYHAVAKWVIAATGSLDLASLPDWPGLDTFEGEWYHASKYPRDAVDLTGKRVGIIGTGSSGIQAVTAVGEVAGHLTVFQRTAQFTLPARNQPMPEDYEREWKAHYGERREFMRSGPHIGMTPPPGPSILDVSPEERLRMMEEGWNSRSGLKFMRMFRDTSTNLEANEILADFVRGKIKEIVKDPVTAERLTPRGYPIGAKRICMDTGYWETFNRPNVDLVDVKETPIVEITPKGMRTTEAEYELDVIIFATGFDAMTGALEHMNITGIGGLRLKDHWKDGPRTHLGVFVSGFPNLLMVHGPGSPSVLAQMITSGELQVDWELGFIDRVEADGIETVNATREAEDRWHDVLEDCVSKTLFGYADSWYLGANIPGKPRGILIYSGAYDTYLERLAASLENGYDGFVLERP
jgi:cation diffusion facilitator CzcD-associated flavoprotein CzcO